MDSSKEHNGFDLNQGPEIKLEMTVDEVKQIMGEPALMETDGWGEPILYYLREFPRG